MFHFGLLFRVLCSLQRRANEEGSYKGDSVFRPKFHLNIMKYIFHQRVGSQLVFLTSPYFENIEPSENKFKIIINLRHFLGTLW